MSHIRLANQVRSRRIQRGWSQAELARRAAISRTAVSAIEGQRLTPSVMTAMTLATVFDCSVEDLFGEPAETESNHGWAWPPTPQSHRYWRSLVGSRLLNYPVEPTLSGSLAHDGVFRKGRFDHRSSERPDHTLVIACCDPAAGMLAEAYARRTGFRLIALHRSSRSALKLLGDDLVHVAGLHLSSARQAKGNAPAVAEQLGEGYRLIHVARWQEGVAVAPSLGIQSIKSAMDSQISWVGREPGSGARQCLDELFEGRRPPRRHARDHRGVAEAIRCGWADAGVCLRIAGQEAGLNFISLRWEKYDWCVPQKWESDPRVVALMSLIRDATFRKQLNELPGYDSRDAGNTQVV